MLLEARTRESQLEAGNSKLTRLFSGWFLPYIDLMAYQPKDAFYRKAKKEGFRSRAAYKLVELDRRFRLVRPGDRVVDLGAAPGGWLQVVARLVGTQGKVVGVDLQPIGPLAEPNVVLLQGDIFSAQTEERIKEIFPRGVDCVLSDLSPRLSGIRDADIRRSIELARAALRLAGRLLRPGGNFLVKSFVGDELKEFAQELSERFDTVQRTRPEATRKGSSEIYLCAKGFRALASAEEENSAGQRKEGASIRP